MQLDPGTLPDLCAIRQRAMALAMLDAIICPEIEYRYFSFEPAWRAGEQLAAMRNGDGDEWFLHLGPAGAAIKGLAHALPRDGQRALAREVRRQLPTGFASFLDEPAFSMHAVGFCYWRGVDDRLWRRVGHPYAEMADENDGSADFLSILLAPASCYQEYASDYFECDAPLASIEHIYAHLPLSAAVVHSLNPQLGMAEAQAAAAALGYPLAMARLEHCATA
jgi:hypothetical protein